MIAPVFFLIFALIVGAAPMANFNNGMDIIGEFVRSRPSPCRRTLTTADVTLSAQHH